jgi:shikimate kinase
MSNVDLNVVSLNAGNSITEPFDDVVANISGGCLRYQNRYKYLNKFWNRNKSCDN